MTRTPHPSAHGSLSSYTVGFILSLACTFGAFYASTLNYGLAVSCIAAAAVLQLIIQLVFFMHLGRRGSGRSHQFIFWFTILVIAIIIGGTLWIMTNLQRLHVHMPGTGELYEGGVVAPQNELR